jgi:transcriptional regulator of arginine metabolism
MPKTKAQRQKAIRDAVNGSRVASQRELRELLAERGFTVNQATLSRDLHELRLVKVPAAGGGSYYAEVEDGESAAALERLLPALFLSAEGTGNQLVVRTVTGGAQPVALAIDQEDWPELLGTIAGDDTILLILKEAKTRGALTRRLEKLAGQ